MEMRTHRDKREETRKGERGGQQGGKQGGEKGGGEVAWAEGTRGRQERCKLPWLTVFTNHVRLPHVLSVGMRVHIGERGYNRRGYLQNRDARNYFDRAKPSVDRASVARPIMQNRRAPFRQMTNRRRTSIVSLCPSASPVARRTRSLRWIASRYPVNRDLKGFVFSLNLERSY